MKFKNRMMLTTCLSAALVLGAVPAAFAQEAAVGIKLGTLGVGVEVSTPIVSHLNGRLGLNYFSYEDTQNVTDIDYDIDARLLTVSALLDWHPMNNGLRLSAGLFYNGNEATVKSKDTGAVDIGNQTFNLAPGDRITGDVDFNKVAPYLGVGWGQAFGEKGHWSVLFDLGVLFQGSANVDLAAEGALASNPLLNSALQQEEDDLQDKADDYQYYPVIALGVSYRF